MAAFNLKPILGFNILEVSLSKLASTTKMVHFSSPLAAIQSSLRLKIFFTPWKQCFMGFLYEGEERTA